MLMVTTVMMSHTSSKRFFEATLVQIVELLFIFLVLSPSDIGLLHRPYDSFYICLHLNWNSGDALRQKSRFVHNNCDNVFWIGACVLAFSIYGLCFMKAIGPSPRHTI